MPSFLQKMQKFRVLQIKIDGSVMKKLPKYFTLFFVLCILPRTSYSQNDSLVIATFNCEFLTRPKVHIKFGLPFNIGQASPAERQQWNEPGFRDARFNEAAGAVAGVLRAINADVLALTEVGDSTDVLELRDEINKLGINYPHVIVGRTKDFTTRQHVAVLSKFPLNDPVLRIPGREIYLQEPDDPETEKDTGLSKGMRVKVSAHEKEFLLYVVHLSSERGGHEQDQQRIAQASIVRRHYLPNLKNHEMVIVAGDLNDKKGQPTIHRIRGLDDIQEDLIQTGLVNFWDKAQLDSRWTYQFQGVRQQIDHILLSFSIREVTKSIAARSFDHRNRLASDHRPLIVTLHLN